MNKGYRKGNRYETEGKVTKVFFNNCDDYFLCDTEDVELLNKHTWHKTRRGYASAYRNYDHVFAHVLLIGEKQGLEIDHINQNKLDNRKENLRHVSHTDNIHNVDYSFRKKRNPATGVEYRCGKTKETYIAYISINHKKLHLGCFESLEEAKRARQEAEVFYWGKQA